jgi:hypothetical protein
LVPDIGRGIRRPYDLIEGCTAESSGTARESLPAQVGFERAPVRTPTRSRRRAYAGRGR